MNTILPTSSAANVKSQGSAEGRQETVAKQAKADTRETRGKIDRSAKSETFKEGLSISGNQPSLGTVDSGIGGAMAGMLISGELKHLAAQYCLPIGDKAPFQVISYTAQMCAEGLIGQGHDDIIVACNTASTSKKECCELLTEFILHQSETDTPGYDQNSPEMNRLKELGNEIRAKMNPDDPRAHYSVMESKVHEVVSPTAQSAANKAFDKLVEGGQDDFLIVVDSTAATAGTGLYPARISDALTTKMHEQGYERTSPDGPDQRATEKGIVTDKSLTDFQKTTVDVQVFEFAKGSETKTLIVQGRGHPSWVPNIEGGRLNDTTGNGAETVAQALVNGASEAARTVRPEGLSAAQQAKLDGQPDLLMMCCTHYPAMVSSLSESNTSSDFLTQDVVVKQMAEKITGETYGEVREEDTLQITRGEAATTPEQAQAAIDAIRSVHPTNPREITIDPMGSGRFSDYANLHSQLHYNLEQINNNDRVGGPLLHQKHSGSHSLWSQATAAEDRMKRTDIELVSSIKTSLPGDTPKVKKDANASPFHRNEAVAENQQILYRNDAAKTLLDNARNARVKLDGLGMTGQQILQANSVAGELARASLEGAQTGIQAIASRHETSLEMFSSAASIANLFEVNKSLDAEGDDPKKRLAVAVGGGVDKQGIIGSLVLAKLAQGHDTPVTFLVDAKDAQETRSAAVSMGLTSQFGSISNVRIEVIPDATDANLADRNKAISDHLKEEDTGILISVGRQGANQIASLHNDSAPGASVAEQDLESIFNDFTSGEAGNDVKTIGIASTGGEIGSATVESDVSKMRLPNNQPAIANGDKIASKSVADGLILSSKVGEGALALSLGVNYIMQDFAPSSFASRPPSSSELADSFVTLANRFGESTDQADNLKKISAP